MSEIQRRYRLPYWAILYGVTPDQTSKDMAKDIFYAEKGWEEPDPEAEPEKLTFLHVFKEIQALQNHAWTVRWMRKVERHSWAYMWMEGEEEQDYEDLFDLNYLFGDKVVEEPPEEPMIECWDCEIGWKFRQRRGEPCPLCGAKVMKDP